MRAIVTITLALAAACGGQGSAEVKPGEATAGVTPAAWAAIEALAAPPAPGDDALLRAALAVYEAERATLGELRAPAPAGWTPPPALEALAGKLAAWADARGRVPGTVAERVETSHPWFRIGQLVLVYARAGHPDAIDDVLYLAMRLRTDAPHLMGGVLGATLGIECARVGGELGLVPAALSATAPRDEELNRMLAGEAVYAASIEAPPGLARYWAIGEQRRAVRAWASLLDGVTADTPRHVLAAQFDRVTEPLVRDVEPVADRVLDLFDEYHRLERLLDSTYR